MERSKTRILTTHTGSLPRPRELTRLYALRARGELIDEADLSRIGQEAVRAVVRKQRDAGIDVANNGEQQHDSFFLYLKGRLSGLGGSWERPSRADVDRYPEDLPSACGPNSTRARRKSPRSGGYRKRSATSGISTSALSTPSATSSTPSLEERPRRFHAEPFMSAPSPGIVATAVRNEHYDTLASYLSALGNALQRSNTEAIVAHGLLLQIDAPDLALERPHHLQGSVRFRLSLLNLSN